MTERGRSAKADNKVVKLTEIRYKVALHSAEHRFNQTIRRFTDAEH